MGIGLVDPILKPIADQLDATPSQVSLLFTSYMAVMGVAMLVTGVVSSRIGAKRTLLLGLALIIVFAGLAGLVRLDRRDRRLPRRLGPGQRALHRHRAVDDRRLRPGSTAQAIILFEAALGLGIAAGPLLGGALGSITWRAPFLGVAVLMTIAWSPRRSCCPPTPARRSPHVARRPVPGPALPRPAARSR